MNTEMLKGFPPELGDAPSVLVLGTLPSVQSLANNQYYGNPRNGFWPIVERIAGVKFTRSYEEKLAILDSLGIALWDVYQQAERQGSLDSNIGRHSAQVNDFSKLLNNSTIKLVACNGAAAFKAFESSLTSGFLEQRGIVTAKLPSTSPAYAAMSLDDKYAVWFAELNSFLRL
jgi:hypoxanthine-DNA glycosylase